ncbi:MAG: helix-turn-helix transcriptional regulator [Candidatus Saccharimonadales bacterium]
MQQVGEAIRLYRYQQGVSQAETAEGAGLPQSAIARLESGRSNPTLRTLLNVTLALGLHIVIVDEPLGNPQQYHTYI